MTEPTQTATMTEPTQTATMTEPPQTATMAAEPTKTATTTETEELVQPNAGYCDSFPAPGLRQIFRHITGHNSEGKSVFLSSDHGSHFRTMGEQQAVANILYSTQETPVELNGNVDIEKAAKDEVSCPFSTTENKRNMI